MSKSVLVLLAVIEFITGLGWALITHQSAGVVFCIVAFCLMLLIFSLASGHRGDVS